jgi:hypothetical protein
VGAKEVQGVACIFQSVEAAPSVTYQRNIFQKRLKSLIVQSGNKLESSFLNVFVTANPQFYPRK